MEDEDEGDLKTYELFYPSEEQVKQTLFILFLKWQSGDIGEFTISSGTTSDNLVLRVAINDYQGREAALKIERELWKEIEELGDSQRPKMP